MKPTDKQKNPETAQTQEAAGNGAELSEDELDTVAGGRSVGAHRDRGKPRDPDHKYPWEQ